MPRTQEFAERLAQKRAEAETRWKRVDDLAKRVGKADSMIARQAQEIAALRHRLDEFETVVPRLHCVADAFYAIAFCIAYLDCACGREIGDEATARDVYHCLKLLEKWSETARRGFASARRGRAAGDVAEGLFALDPD